MKFICTDDGVGINFIHFYKIENCLHRLVIDTKFKWPSIQKSSTFGSEEYVTIVFLEKEHEEICGKCPKLIGRIDIVPENEQDAEILNGVLIQESSRYGFSGYFVGELTENKMKLIYSWESLKSKLEYEKFEEEEKRKEEQNKEIERDWPYFQ